MTKLKLISSTIIISILMGIISAVFLTSLELVTNLRKELPYLILLLPVIGVLTTYVYSKYGGDSSKGNNLIIESVHKELSLIHISEPTRPHD